MTSLHVDNNHKKTPQMKMQMIIIRKHHLVTKVNIRNYENKNITKVNIRNHHNKTSKVHSKGIVGKGRKRT